MKKFLFFFMFCLSELAAFAQSELPQWAIDLKAKTPEVIDSIRFILPQKEKSRPTRALTWYIITSR